MPDPSSKELFMMNGGKKHYIYTDGYGDIYHATDAEEAEWTKELIQKEIGLLDTMDNPVNLKSAVETLQYHHYEDLIQLIFLKLETATRTRRIVFANCLWNLSRYAKSFDLILEELVQHREECIDDVFLALIDFRMNRQAREFLVDCLEGTDEQYHKKAQITLVMWSYSGMPELRSDNFLEELKPEKRNAPGFNLALKRLKMLLHITS